MESRSRDQRKFNQDGALKSLKKEQMKNFGSDYKSCSHYDLFCKYSSKQANKFCICQFGFTIYRNRYNS